MRGPGSDLFDFMVDVMVELLQSHNMLEEATVNQPFHLGFTFSFPTKQHSLNKADLAGWTKGYTCEGVEGQDVGMLLRAAIDKRPELNVEVCNNQYISTNFLF
jgi:hexokinase